MHDLRFRIERAQEQLGSNVENESELHRLRQVKKNLQTNFDNAKKVAALDKQAKSKEKEQAKVDQLRDGLAEKKDTLLKKVSTLQ